MNEKKKKAAAEASGQVYVSDGMSPAVVIGKLYNSAFWGMVIGVLCTRSTWLAMRVNVGWLFYAGWVLTFLLALMFTSFKCGPKFSIINVAVCIVIMLIASGNALLVTPAAVARMGVGLLSVPFETVNIIMLVFTIVGFGLVFFLHFRKAKKQRA